MASKKVLAVTTPAIIQYKSSDLRNAAAKGNYEKVTEILDALDASTRDSFLNETSASTGNTPLNWAIQRCHMALGAKGSKGVDRSASYLKIIDKLVKAGSDLGTLKGSGIKITKKEAARLSAYNWAQKLQEDYEERAKEFGDILIEMNL